jgi:hypothetical protein
VQADTSKFYVERVDVITKYDSRYILGLANQIVAPDKLISKSDVECLVNELKESGIFADVQAELTPTEQKDVYRLLLTTVYHPQIKSFVVNEIALEGLPDVDKAKFQLSLHKEGLVPGVAFLKYPFNELEDKVGGALREAYLKSSAEAEGETYWITIRPIGEEKLKLIVSPTYSRCSASAKK